MSYQQVFRCDVCDAVRGPSNHWLLSWVCRGNEITFKPWDDTDAEAACHTHLCGETCAATHLTRFIAKSREEAQ